MILTFNSLERVKAAINFTNPDKVPIWRPFGKSDVFTLARMPSKQWQPGYGKNEQCLFPHVESDLIIKSHLWNWEKPDWAEDPKFEKWLDIPREEIDEWGTIWKRSGVNTMGHPSKPSLLDYRNTDEYFQKYTPIFDDMSSYSFFVELSKKMGEKKYRMCLLDLGPFQIAANMRGFNSLLLDHKQHKEKLEYLLEYLTNQYIKFEKMWVKSGAKPHGFIMYDDLGEQKGPFFNPRTFKEFYEPVYKRLIDTAHKLECDFHLHSCGKIDKLIPLLIEWGLDAIELDSPRMIGYPALSKFRGKIMIWGCVNIQSIYPIGTPEQCEREVWHMIRNLGTEKGGYGAYFYPQEDHIKAPRVNIDAFSAGLNKYGVYSRIPDHWWTYPVVVEWKYDEVPPLPPL